MAATNPIRAVNAILSEHGLPAYGSPGSVRFLTPEQARLAHLVMRKLHEECGRINAMTFEGRPYVTIGQQSDGLIRIGGLPDGREERYGSLSEFAAAYGLE